MDPTGLKKAPRHDECCCCAIKLTKSIFEEFNGPIYDGEVYIMGDQKNPYYGHKFNVYADIEYKFTKRGTAGSKCKVEWFEKSDGPAENPGIDENGERLPPFPPGTWHEPLKDDYLGTLRHWKKHYEEWEKRQSCAGAARIRMFDSPSVRLKAFKNYSRRLYIAVRITSSKDCDCDKACVTTYITQQLTVKNGSPAQPTWIKPNIPIREKAGLPACGESLPE